MSVAQVFIYIAISFIPVALAVGLYVLFKYIIKVAPSKDNKFFNLFKDEKKSYWIRQISVGIIFGCVGIGTYYLGINIKDFVNDKLMKVGTSSFYPVVSGLVFGGPTALISSFILFLFRIFTPSMLKWPTVIAIVIGGFATAFASHRLFKGRCKKWFYAMFTGMFVETANILLIFLFNLGYVALAYRTLCQFDFCCILCHAGACALTVLFICLINKEKVYTNFFKERKIQTRLQLWLFVMTIVSLTASVATTYIVVFADAAGSYKDIMTNALYDVDQDFKSFQSAESYKYVPDRHLVSEKGFNLIINEDKITIEAAPKLLVQKRGELVGTSFIFDDGKTLKDKKESIVHGTISNSEVHIFNVSLNNEKCYLTYSKVVDELYDPDKIFYSVIIVPVDEVRASSGISARTVLYADLIVFIALFAIVNLFITSKIVNKVEIMDRSLEKIIDGQLDEEIHLESSYKEFETLSNNINLTIGALKNYGLEIEKRMEDELLLAKSIQSNAVPTLFPIEKNYNIYAMMRTAKDVGGDFYDYYKMNNGLVMFLIADVSGKGIPGALFMMRAKTIIKSLSATGSSIEEIVTRANKELLSENEAGLFVTAWIGVLNPTTGELKYVNAGHNTPLIKRAGGQYELFEGNHNLVLAGYDNYQFKSETVYLKKGDEILLYTDGVTEAVNTNNEQYGLPRLMHFANHTKYFNAKQLLENISDDVFKFSAGKVEQFDDITMVSLRYDGNDDIKPDNVLTIKAFPKNASIAVNFVESILTNAELDQKLIAKMSIVVDELFANVAFHAYEHMSTGDLVIEVDIKDDNLKMVFIDSGVEFDSTKATDPDVNESIETRKRGGLGLFIVRNSVDKMTYKRDSGYNVLTIEKKIK